MERVSVCGLTRRLLPAVVSSWAWWKASVSTAPASLRVGGLLGQADRDRNLRYITGRFVSGRVFVFRSKPTGCRATRVRHCEAGPGPGGERPAGGAPGADGGRGARALPPRVGEAEGEGDRLVRRLHGKNATARRPFCCCFKGENSCGCQPVTHTREWEVPDTYPGGYGLGVTSLRVDSSCEFTAVIVKRVMIISKRVCSQTARIHLNLLQTHPDCFLYVPAFFFKHLAPVSKLFVCRVVFDCCVDRWPHSVRTLISGKEKIPRGGNEKNLNNNGLLAFTLFSCSGKFWPISPSSCAAFLIIRVWFLGILTFVA